MKRQVQLLGLLATAALLVLVGADDLSMDALFKEDVKTTLDMINRPDGFAGLGDDEDWEAGLDALLETSAKQKGHAASRAKMHAHIEDSIGEAIHEHLQEHLEAGRKEADILRTRHAGQTRTLLMDTPNKGVKEGIKEVAGTVADFFKRLFNCNKCTLGSGNTGQSITKMFTDAAGKLKTARKTILEQEFKKVAKDDKMTKEQYVTAMKAVETLIVNEYKKFTDDKDGQQKGTINQVTSPFLVRDAEGRKFWLASVNGEKEVFSGIFDNIHLKKLNVKKDLEEACSAQSVEGLEDAVSVNAKKCQQNEDCEKLISRPVLTGGSKLLCVPNFAAIDKKVAAEPKPADKDATEPMSVMIESTLAELISFDLTEAEGESDMQVSPGNALEWAVAPEPSPWPNAMRSYICEPLSGGQGGNMNFNEPDTVVPGIDTLRNAGETETEAAANKQDETNPEALTGDSAEIEQVRGTENTGLLHKIIISVKKKLGQVIGAVAHSLKFIWKLMYTAMRCGVCVICNLVEELVAFAKSFGEKIKKLWETVKNSIKTMAKKIGMETLEAAKNTAAKVGDVMDPRSKNFLGMGAKREEGAPAIAVGGQCKFDADCGDDVDVAYCGSTGMVTPNVCFKSRTLPRDAACRNDKDCMGTTDIVFDKDFKAGGRSELYPYGKEKTTIGPQKYHDRCATKVFSANKCEKISHQDANNAKNKELKAEAAKEKGQKFFLRRLLREHVGLNRRLGSERAQKVRKKLKRLQRLERVLGRMATTAGSMNRDSLEARMMSRHAAKHLISSTIRKMTTHSKVVASSEAAQSHLAMHSHTNMLRTQVRGSALEMVPNACIREGNLGSGVGIAINVENPSLLEYIFKMLSSVSKAARGKVEFPVPEILIAIFTTTFDNKIVDQACLQSASLKTVGYGSGGTPAKPGGEVPDHMVNIPELSADSGDFDKAGKGQEPAVMNFRSSTVADAGDATEAKGVTTSSGDRQSMDAMLTDAERLLIDGRDQTYVRNQD